jgi:DNA repair photolyase
MIKTILAERKSDVLAASSLSCLSHIPAVNLTSGCAHGCLYCYARGYSTYPGENKVVVYQNTLEKLKKEIFNKRIKPSEVYFSPSSDIFQPVPEVLHLGYSVLEHILSGGIGVAFLTKGKIPENTMSLLFKYADKVRAQIGIITTDDSIRQIFEPNAAAIEVRLQQMRQMIAGGIAVEARLMPILPGITDADDSIERLFEAIVQVGVKQAAISTLFIRPSIVESLRRRVQDRGTIETMLNLYKNMGRIAVHAKNSTVIPLPRPKREEIYGNIGKLAEKYNIDLSVCGCMNPDIGGTCNIAGLKSLQYAQPVLFE